MSLHRPFVAWLAALLAAGVLACPAPGQLLGAAAPPDRWTQVGGSPSRSGQSLGEPVRGPVEVSWAHELAGPIEGEPLVWDDLVLVVFRRDERTRVLRALDLLSGQARGADAVFDTPLPLAPCLWGDVVVLRSGPEEVQALRVAPRHFQRLWTLDADDAVGEPLLVGTQLYLTVGPYLQRHVVRRTRPEWRIDGAFGGRLALRGDELYVLSSGQSERVVLSARSTESGQVLWEQVLGRTRLGGPGAEAGLDLAALPGRIFVSNASGFSIGRAAYRTVLFDTSLASAERLSGLADQLASAPAAWHELWLAPMLSPQALVLTSADDSSALVVLADEGNNPDFAVRGVAPTVVGRVGYVGARAFDLDTYRVLWRLPVEASTRAVPARRTVLVGERVSETSSRLLAIRPLGGDPDTLTWSAAGPIDASPGTLVLRDGSIIEGRFRVSPATGSVEQQQRGAAPGPWDLDDVLLAEGSDRDIRWARSGDAVVRGVEVLSRRALAQDLAALCYDACDTNDPALVERLAERAWSLGSEDVRIEAALARAERMGTKKVSVRHRRKVIARETALAERPVELLWEHLAALPDDVPDALTPALLAALLALDPDHEPALALLASRTSADFVPPEPFDPLDWLDFVEARRRHPLTVLRPGEAGAGDAGLGDAGLGGAGVSGPDGERLRTAARRWRKDVLGFRSEHLLIITSAQRPGAIARALEAGELVTRALEQIFRGSLADIEVGEAQGERLTLELFESRAEYLAHSDGRSEQGAGLAWAAGHYDVEQQLSRIFIPDDDSSFSQVLQTYAHELTHHWLDLRLAVLQDRAGRAPGPDLPGFWIVEGLAGLLEGFSYDRERGTWDTRLADTYRLELVANAGDEQIIPWEDLFSMSQRVFGIMPYTGEPAIGMTSHLGKRTVVTPRSMYYAQATAAVRYLFLANDGEHRTALLDYVLDQAMARPERLDVSRAFHKDPDELGLAITVFARAETARATGGGTVTPDQ